MARITLATVLMALSLSLPALSPAPPQAGDELLPLLYETLDGDNWHRNDGWLDPEVHWCDWYGVSCSPSGLGYQEFRRLELPGNNLRGEFTAELARLLFRDMAPDSELDLSDNAISGTLPYFPEHTQSVDLSRNQLSGALPEVADEPMMPEGPGRVLAHNQFEGDIPASWDRLQLTRLDLSGNRLDGQVENAFRAIRDDTSGYLDIAGNDFSGELPAAEVTATSLYRHDDGTFGGLNLCWNDFTIDDPELDAWIGEHHIGGASYTECINRTRLAVGPQISGSWFHPARGGEGLTMMLLENGSPLLYWFSYDTEGRQQWGFEGGQTHEYSLQWPRLVETRGDFGLGIRDDGYRRLMRTMMRARLDPVRPNTLHFERQYFDATGCPPLEDPPEQYMPCPLTPISDRLDYTRLTHLAGTSCDQVSDAQHLSGSWYDPERSGEGFVLEVLPDDQAVVYWFTYAPDGSGLQAWMIGVGTMDIPDPKVALAPVENIKFHTDDLVQPIGGVYGADFDPDAIEMRHWGELSIVFHGDLSAHVQYDSVHEEYGSGDYPIERLAKPKLAECGE